MSKSLPMSSYVVPVPCFMFLSDRPVGSRFHRSHCAVMVRADLTTIIIYDLYHFGFSQEGSKENSCLNIAISRVLLKP